MDAPTVRPGRSPSRNNARERILEAAAKVAKTAGATHLSLEAVAEKAGVSKGGLLYHFPSKQALLTAVVEHFLTKIEADCGLNDPGDVDGTTLALQLMQSWRANLKDKGESGRAFLAAVAENPALLDPLRDHNRRVAERLRQSSAPEVAFISFFVVEGMRALHLFGTNPISDQECEAVLARLSEVLKERAAAKVP